jgi:hypothetical protein
MRESQIEALITLLEANWGPVKAAKELLLKDYLRSVDIRDAEPAVHTIIRENRFFPVIAELDEAVRNARRDRLEAERNVEHVPAGELPPAELFDLGTILGRVNDRVAELMATGISENDARWQARRQIVEEFSGKPYEIPQGRRSSEPEPIARGAPTTRTYESGERQLAAAQELAEQVRAERSAQEADERGKASG